MRRLTASLPIALAALLIPVTQGIPIARASGGSSTGQIVAVYRDGCAATSSGDTVGTARFASDDQGGNPGGLEIRTGITAGLPRTVYAEYVLTGSCQVIASVGTLKTDDSGRGDLDVHVAASSLPAGGSVRVQLVAPTDTLTSDPAAST